MSSSYRKIFWGFLLVLIEIHIIAIDLLPDPIGYYFIFSGISKIVEDYQFGKNAKNLSMFIIFISVPTVFLQQTTSLNQFGQITAFSIWPMYMIVLGILKLILVFYVFQLLMKIVNNLGAESLIRRASNTFKIYMSVMFVLTIFQSFTMNLSNDLLIALSVVFVVLSLIMEISFLLLIRKIGKVIGDHPEDNLNAETTTLDNNL
ncbi:hypothetical protein [Alkalihalobacillus sp. AL-G]|uniref:hypothetical protein n=1 Tax=Alkalihalobacillus sp. AL-G TaxID=2926399 RepID=UPI00272ABBFB|nr:hypothetical protein [Alkalihalobacillus sp. AL-G]WLD91735.1 hypothetical protein MOJ78_11845 [Alkalihalobacillus sp. AL-G]